MKTLHVAAIVWLSVTIGTCLLFGTVGWFVVGFGAMTDCTTSYSCSTSGCAPCATTRHWINAGGITQWALAVTGVVVMVRGLRASRPASLAVGGAALLALSFVTMIGSTWQAQASHCRPGSPGYVDSSCSVDG